jgi:hypothetical protein
MPFDATDLDGGIGAAASVGQPQAGVVAEMTAAWRTPPSSNACDFGAFAVAQR